MSEHAMKTSPWNSKNTDAALHLAIRDNAGKEYLFNTTRTRGPECADPSSVVFGEAINELCKGDDLLSMLFLVRLVYWFCSDMTEEGLDVFEEGDEIPQALYEVGLAAIKVKKLLDEHYQSQSQD